MGNGESKPKKKPMFRGYARRPGEWKPWKVGFEIRDELLDHPKWRDAPELPPRNTKAEKLEKAKKEAFEKGFTIGVQQGQRQTGRGKGGAPSGMSRGGGSKGCGRGMGGGRGPTSYNPGGSSRI